MAQDDDVVALFVWQEGVRYLVAGSAGRGFVTEAADLLAEKRTGKQVLNVRPGETLLLCTPAAGDHVATIAASRKLLVFPLDQVPVIGRGTGVMLQKGLVDAKVFTLADGLTWRLGEKVRTETDIRTWLGLRAQSGKLPPNGFPRSGRFT